jgi:hypothetical protein
MKLQYKKYLYFINDITNLLLEKEQTQAQEQARKLRIALLIIGAILFISLSLNIYLIFVN